jgi:hypothetical protein
MPSKMQKKEKKGNWGPILVAKRPTRGLKDGRTVLGKAQGRKKKANLEEPRGISKNSFSILSTVEISEIAKDTGISLGMDHKSEEQTGLDLLDNDKSRKTNFNKTCLTCKLDDSSEVVSTGLLGDNGDDAPCTPVTHTFRPPSGELSDEKGQWTYVGNRKK